MVCLRQRDARSPGMESILGLCETCAQRAGIALGDGWLIIYRKVHEDNARVSAKILLIASHTLVELFYTLANGTGLFLRRMHRIYTVSLAQRISNHQWIR